MIVGLDSATSPTLDQAKAAAAGVGLWSGYIATRSGVNLLRPWMQADFQVVQRAVNPHPVAFCSGLDDPIALKALAANWGVRLCLDVESGIRGDGSWVQGWLDDSGAGLYGQHYQDTNGVWHSIHLDRRAAFHVMSWYIGRDPSATWIGPQPADGAPLAWQWAGSHQEFGVEVDRGWYDDWFGEEMNAQQDAFLTDIHTGMGTLVSFVPNQPEPLAFEIRDRLVQVQNQLATLSTPVVDVNALATALATHPLTATLSDAERDAIATHVLQHLSKDTAAG